MKNIAFALLVTSFLVPTAALASSWEIDPAHSEVTFTVKHMMVSTVTGYFAKFTGTAEIDDKDVAQSNAQVNIEAASVDTRNEKRDSHLRSADFFDVEKTPQITFKTAKVEKDGKGLKLTGDLTIRGITHPVTFTAEDGLVTAPFKDPMGRQKKAINATAKIHRKDWNLMWNKALEGGGLLVSDEVTLTINAQLGPTQKKTVSK